MTLILSILLVWSIVGEIINSITPDSLIDVIFYQFGDFGVIVFGAILGPAVFTNYLTATLVHLYYEARDGGDDVE